MQSLQKLTSRLEEEKKIKAPEVKVFAEKHAIPVFQPKSLKGITVSNDGQLSSSKASASPLVDFLNRIKPIDFFVVAAYGKIMPEVLLEFPKVSCLNIHASLLPRWRGAAPIHRAIFAGDAKTGICLMEMEVSLDTGPVYVHAETEIDSSETFGSLHDRLAQMGSELLVASLPEIQAGTLLKTPQAQEGITYAEKWTPEDAQICWADPADQTDRRIRTCTPNPGARTTYKGLSLKIFSARVIDDQNFGTHPPGTIVEVNKFEIILSTGSEKFIAIDEMQIPGKKRLKTEDLLRGFTVTAFEQFK